VTAGAGGFVDITGAQEDRCFGALHRGRKLDIADGKL